LDAGVKRNAPTFLFNLLERVAEEVCRLCRIREIREIRVFCFPFLLNTMFLGAAEPQPNRNLSPPATNVIPRRPYAPISLCPPYVIASGAKQSPLPRDPRLLRSARNEMARVFRAAAMLARNAAIERVAKKDAGVSCSKNKEMMGSSLSWRLAAPGNG